ncbi:MAG TPA: hypothetical protein VIN05_06685 [Roseovarius sp.]
MPLDQIAAWLHASRVLPTPIALPIRTGVTPQAARQTSGQDDNSI